MTLTSHGHHIPFSPTDDEEVRFGATLFARCGGPGICRRCSREASAKIGTGVSVGPDGLIEEMDVVSPFPEMTPEDIEAAEKQILGMQHLVHIPDSINQVEVYRKVIEKIRANHPKPNKAMSLARHQQLTNLHAFIDALEEVVNEMENDESGL